MCVCIYIYIRKSSDRLGRCRFPYPLPRCRPMWHPGPEISASSGSNRLLPCPHQELSLCRRSMAYLLRHLLAAIATRRKKKDPRSWIAAHSPLQRLRVAKVSPTPANSQSLLRRRDGRSLPGRPCRFC